MQNFIRETTCCRHSGRNGWKFQRVYYPIRRTGRQNNWFRGTCWCEELIKKWFHRTGWCNKLFQKIGCRWKQSIKRSNYRYSHYQWYFSYWHYKWNFNTKINHQPNHPISRPTHYTSRHHQSGGRAREFEPAPDVSPTDERHGCARLLEPNWDGKGPRHANWQFFFQNKI